LGKINDQMKKNKKWWAYGTSIWKKKNCYILLIIVISEYRKNKNKFLRWTFSNYEVVK
jgi:hypothetical protein